MNRESRSAIDPQLAIDQPWSFSSRRYMKRIDCWPAARCYLAELVVRRRYRNGGSWYSRGSPLHGQVTGNDLLLHLCVSFDVNHLIIGCLVLGPIADRRSCPRSASPGRDASISIKT